MKRHIAILITKTIIVFTIVALIDIVLGGILKQAFFNQKSGRYYRTTEALYGSEADVMIFGSSIANHSCNPQILTNSLKLSSYNAGVRGQSVFFAQAIQEVVLERYKPKVMILLLEPYILYERPDFYDRLADLSPYYRKEPAIREIMTLSEKNDFKYKYFSYSNLIVFNSTILHILKYRLRPQADIRGHLPMYDAITPVTIAQIEKERKGEYTPEIMQSLEIDTNVYRSLEKFFSNAQEANIPILCVFAPEIRYADYSKDESFKLINELAIKYKVKTMDYNNHPDFTYQYHYWGDNVHLNNKGADYFTSLLATDIKDILQTEKPDLTLN